MTKINDILFQIVSLVQPMKACSDFLEISGAALMQRQPIYVFGKNLISAGQAMAQLSPLLESLPSNDDKMAKTIAIEAAQRCQYASAQMILAGTSLCPSTTTDDKQSSSKSWLKGGV
jgi:hypothetical protein